MGLGQIEWLGEVDSTNDEARRRFVGAPDAFVPFATIATTSQTGGHGRLGREWVAPAGASLAMTAGVEFPAEAARESLGWVSLAAGLAVHDAIGDLAPDLAHRIRLKWPNDVLIDGRKVCGVLGELLGVIDGGRAFACAIGIGVNLAIPAEELPTPTATSLDIVGVRASAHELAPRILDHLEARVGALIAASGDADASGLRAAVRDACSTLGQDVRAHLPGDATLEGRATDLGAGGELRIVDDRGTVHTIQVGDLEHLRPQSGEWSA